MRSSYWCWWWKYRYHTVIIATNACRTFGANKLTHCLVVYAVQLFSSEVLVWWQRSAERWSLQMHAIMSLWMKASDWFNLISLPMCSVLILHVCSVCPFGKLLFTKKTKNSTHLPPCCLRCLLMSFFREGFLKKDFEADPLSWFKGEILYLFCTCIINRDVFNYFGCWNKACEVVYSVAEFSLSCLQLLWNRYQVLGFGKRSTYWCQTREGMSVQHLALI